MRILYIHQYFATRRGTTGTRSYEQWRAMEADGHEVTMLTSSACLLPEEIPPGRGSLRKGTVDGVDATVLIIPYDQRMGYLRRIWSFLSFMFASTRLALTGPRVDLIFATSTPLTVGIPALVAKLFRLTPYVFEVRDLWPDVPAGLGILKAGAILWALRTIEAMIYRHARLVVAVNEPVAGAIRSKSGGRTPVVVVPNACDTDLFRPDRDGLPWRREHGLEGKILCVHTGAMGQVNYLDAILDAAAELGSDDRLRFVLIGRGKEKPRLEERVRRDGLTNVLILGAMPKEELADVLATANVGLMTVAPVPILELNCANKFFDYLATGLPIVLNYQGWQGRLLAEHGCGLSAPQGDAAGFVGAIARLAGDESLRESMSPRARKLAETHLSRRTVVRPMLDAMGRLVSPGRERCAAEC